MKRDLQKMMNTDLGILIIGGGITGAGIARDAANRGIKVALVEKNDFACGSTGRSAMLAYGAFSIFEGKSGSSLKESLYERAVLQYIAKDITNPVTFLSPSYQSDKSKLSYNNFGFTMYNMFAGAKKVQPPQTISTDEVLKLEPNLGKDGLLGGAVYDDFYTSPERLVISNLWDAFEHGAQVANHCEAVSLLEENGKVVGATVKGLLDGKTYEIKAKVVVNATGAWANKFHEFSNGGMKAIHIVVPKFTERAILAFSSSNGDFLPMFYALPQNEYSIIGTVSYVYQDNPDDVSVTQEEIYALLKDTNRVFPSGNLKREDILFAYAGVQPLSNKSKIIKSPQEVVSVITDEIITYRSLSKKVVDMIHEEYDIPQERKCQTDKQPLLYQKFPSEQEAYLRLQDVFEKSPALTTLFKSEKIVKANEYKFRVALACELEMARTPADFLLRRSQLGLRQGLGLDILPIIADHMASFLGWKPEEKQTQIENYKKYIKANYSIS